MDIKCAREIMGPNFFGVNEAIRHLKIDPKPDQLVTLLRIPFSETLLEEVNNTHILVAVFPLSTMKIKKRVPELFVGGRHAWYNNQQFASYSGGTFWSLVRKTPVPGSLSKGLEEQKSLLSEREKIPNVQAMVYTIIGHYLATGEKLFADTYVRTSDVVYDYSIAVGGFDSGLLIYAWRTDDRNDRLGIASAF